MISAEVVRYFLEKVRSARELDGTQVDGIPCAYPSDHFRN